MKIKFLGAARTVTGSKHLITTQSGTKILLDCGMFQGRGQESDEMNRHLGFSPQEVDYLILSHAHIDHAGNIPFLVHQGYRNPIYATPATIDLCRIMLKDSAHIQENDIMRINKRRIKRGESPLKPLYTTADVDEAMKLFVPVNYHEHKALDEEVSLFFTDSGHILGSSAVNLSIKENGKDRKLCFTGDIGRYDGSILRDPDPLPPCEILITESTYGDRLHSSNELSKKELLDAIRHTCVEKKGKLIIPAFSLGRTQELVYALDQLDRSGLIPSIDVFVDSPLSVSATEVIRHHHECFNEDVLEYMERDPDPFGFEKLTYIRDVEDSKALNQRKEPCIIISASGMVEAGRIKHHVANNISDPNNTILIVGYAEPSSIGGRLRRREPRIRIFGEEYPLRAEVIILDSYSAHADYEEMLRYFKALDAQAVKHTFIVHGEYETQIHFKDKLQHAGFRQVHIPAKGDEIEV